MLASRAIEAECFETFNEKDLAILAKLVDRLRDHLGALPGVARKGDARSD